MCFLGNPVKKPRFRNFFYWDQNGTKQNRPELGLFIDIFLSNWATQQKSNEGQREHINAVH